MFQKRLASRKLMFADAEKNRVILEFQKMAAAKKLDEWLHRSNRRNIKERVLNSLSLSLCLSLTHTHARTHTHTHSYTHATRTHTHAHHTWVHSPLHTRTHAHQHALLHTCHTLTHSRTHKRSWFRASNRNASTWRLVKKHWMRSTTAQTIFLLIFSENFFCSIKSLTGNGKLIKF